MQGKLLWGLLFLSACASNPNKVDSLPAEVQKQEDLGGGKVMGLNDKDELVVQKKIKLAEYVRGLEREVYDLEATVYGDDDTGARGKWGVLEDCLVKENSAQLGGEGTYVKMPEKTILTAKEDQIQKIGYDDTKKLVAVSADYLKDRIRRFENYKATYKSRKSWYETQIKICEAKVNAKAFKASKVDMKSYPKAVNLDSEMDAYICRYAKAGARMTDLVRVALDKKWISKDDFEPDYRIAEGSLTDDNKFERYHVLRIGGWALSYNASAEIGDLLNRAHSPALVAWMNDQADLVPNGTSCLRKGSNVWTN